MTRVIDWSDPRSKITEHFTVGEATWLPSWKKYAVPTDAEKVNLIRTCELLEKVRAFVKAPIKIHVMLRPLDYNKFIGGAKKSGHIQGLAVDFSVPGSLCDDIRKLVLPMLEVWGCRMERKDGSNWIHLDLKSPGPGGRYFAP